MNPVLIFRNIFLLDPSYIFLRSMLWFVSSVFPTNIFYSFFISHMRTVCRPNLVIHSLYNLKSTWWIARYEYISLYSLRHHFVVFSLFGPNISLNILHSNTRNMRYQVLHYLRTSCVITPLCILIFMALAVKQQDKSFLN
jgi:hypothetical protein